ncbi:hypothetical protein Bca52824_030854 [Brassica carinata]|uniref:KIB1-4 beta-propeller domain-containing protein n=1 Tax=Brassica carinata TaxID=52824 RepID=A0A8X7S9K9_BRACI|nr:hypothetical protein Bca52824_030854 [Brassica carinata]
MVVMRLELHRLYIGDSLRNLVKAVLGEAVQEEEGRQTTVTRVLRFWEAMTVNKGEPVLAGSLTIRLRTFNFEKQTQEITKAKYRKFREMSQLLSRVEKPLVSKNILRHNTDVVRWCSSMPTYPYMLLDYMLKLADSGKDSSDGQITIGKCSSKEEKHIEIKTQNIVDDVCNAMSLGYYNGALKVGMSEKEHLTSTNNVRPYIYYKPSDDTLKTEFDQDVDEINSSTTTAHFVEAASGEQFFIKWFFKDQLELDSEGLEQVTSRTRQFMVYRSKDYPPLTEHHQKDLSYTEDIGDFCIFLGQGEPFCIRASLHPGLRANCIYFAGYNFGVYDITTRCCNIFYTKSYKGCVPLRSSEFPYWPHPLSPYS